MFFDTADVEYIKKIWSKLQYHVAPEDVVGITTNPNAFHKIGLLKLQEWLDKTKELCELTAKMRGDNLGVVFIQFPSSVGSGIELHQFYLKTLVLGFPHANVGIKIPPFQKFLENKQDKFIRNVTGLSDCGTALKSIAYNVDWISLIPGRMEGVGINFEEQLGYIQGAARKTRTEIITGSMRTVEGLIKCIQYGTVPTIGTTVFNLIDEADRYKEVAASFSHQIKLPSKDFCPRVDEVNQKLSEDFFAQMDVCGAQAYEDLKNS